MRVGLILPLTQNGQPSSVGVSMGNAAQLAVEESGMNDMTMMIVDDHGTPDGAAQAGQAVVGAGAEIILGPLLAADVREVARVAKTAGRPVIAFSTDESVAQPGVYLLSFLIESYADKAAEYAVSKGKKNFAVLAPQSDYANVAVGEFQQAAQRLGARVVTVARYPAGQPQAGVQEIASAPGGYDALFIPEQADGMPALATALAASGDQDADPGHRRVERSARAAPAGAARGVVRRARQRRLQRLRPALQGALQRRSAAARLAVLRRRVAGGGAGARARGATLFARPC